MYINEQLARSRHQHDLARAESWRLARALQAHRRASRRRDRAARRHDRANTALAHATHRVATVAA